MKVLDFGLAKLADVARADSAMPTNDASMSPTFASPSTQLGMILGTAAYMAPEQAKGKSVHRCADIWAFGVVLFEMLTGRALFAGETMTEVLAGVVKKNPNWSALPSTTPPSIRRVPAPVSREGSDPPDAPHWRCSARHR